MKSLHWIAVLTALACLLSCKSSGPEVKLYAFNQATLEQTREQIHDGEFAHMAAYDHLIAQADELLDAKILSVMDKPLVAPSGDKHDYFSMAPYWWPNPDTADGLPYVRRDGETNAEVRKLDNMIMDKMANAVCKLALAYYFTNNEAYAVKAVEQLQTWYINPETRMNPNMDYAQVVLGHDNNWGRCYGIIDKYEFVYVMDAMRILHCSKSFSDEDYAAIQQWYSEFVDWLLTSKNGVAEGKTKNNHANSYDAQVIAFSTFAGREDVARDVVAQFMERRIYKQVQPDGSQPEELARTNGLGYSNYNIQLVASVCNLAKALGVDLLNEQTVEGRTIISMVDYISQYLGVEQSQFPYKQINGWEKAQQKTYLITHWAHDKFPNRGYEKRLNQLKNYQIPETALYWLTKDISMN